MTHINKKHVLWCTNTVESELPCNEVKALLEITVCFEIASFLEPLQVQHVGFLSEAAGWLSAALQRAAGFLHSVGRAVTQVWKQSGIGHVLRRKIPLYLEKIQDVVQQMLNELQSKQNNAKQQ